MSDPLWKGLAFDALIVLRIHESDDGASTVMARAVKWIKREKLAKLGNVNSVSLDFIELVPRVTALYRHLLTT